MHKSPESASTPGYDRLALSFKALGGGLWDYDIEADCLYCNERWYEIMGLSAETSPIRSMRELSAHVHEEDIALATAVDLDDVSDLLARDERYHVEFRVIRPDGEVRWLRSVACIIRDQANHLRAVGCVTDITEFRALGVEPVPWAAADAAGTPAKPSAETPDGGTARGLSEGSGDPLSDRERECLLWVSMGKTAWETASIIGRSQRTVEFHLKNAVRKLNAANKIHAAALAIRQGLL